MRRACSLLLPLLLLGVAACGSDSATGPTPPDYDSIAGTYAGEMVGTSQGVAADLLFGFTINQSNGELSGNWSLSGQLNDGTSTLNVAGTGTLAGTINSGHNPSVNITIKTAACPDYRAAFSGTYDSDNHRVTLTGPVEFFNYNSCDVGLRYQATIILNR